MVRKNLHDKPSVGLGDAISEVLQSEGKKKSGSLLASKAAEVDNLRALERREVKVRITSISHRPFRMS
jgi:hypothetical protein